MSREGYFFQLDRIDGDHLRRIAEKLRAVGFSERTVRKRLGLSRLSDLKLESYPFYIHSRLARREAIDIAIHLFMLQGVIPVEELNLLLDQDDRRLLKSMGVLLGQKSTRTYRSALSLYPQRDFLIFTDHRFVHQPWISARRPQDPVMYMGEEAHYAMRATIRKPVRNALDMCCGAGFHGIYTAAFADRVVGVDLNQRAVNFARLNAIFNNTWNISFVEGDLFDGVRGERFDYILASPPSAPSPGYELRFRDGGPSGADVLRRVVASIPDYLASGGYAQIVANIGERHGEAYLDRIRRWLAGANMNIHALKLTEHPLDDFAVNQIPRSFESNFSSYSIELKRWIDNLRSQRFKRIIQTILTFEWNDDRAMPPWSQEDESKPPRRAIGEDIVQLFQARQRTRRHSAAKDLDHCMVGVPDDLILNKRHSPSGRGFVVKDYRVTWRDPALSPELEIKPLVCELLELVDNRRSVPQIIAKYAQNRGLPVDSIDKKARQAFLAMFERGLVTLDQTSVSRAANFDISGEEIRTPELLDPEGLPDLDKLVPNDPTTLPPLHVDPLTNPPLMAEPKADLGYETGQRPPAPQDALARSGWDLGISAPPKRVTSGRFDPDLVQSQGMQGQGQGQAMPAPQNSSADNPLKDAGSGAFPLGAMAALAAAAKDEHLKSSQAAMPAVDPSQLGDIPKPVDGGTRIDRGDSRRRNTGGH